MYLATEQVFHGRLVEGERALWTQVLSSAIEDLACQGVRWERRALAYQWITTADDTNVGSFQFTCDVLELDATAVRQRILRADQQRFPIKLKLAKKSLHQEIGGVISGAPAPIDSPVMNGSIPSVTIADVAAQIPASAIMRQREVIQTNAPNPRKRGKHMSNGNGKHHHNGNGHIDWLKQQSAQWRSELELAEAAVLRLRPLIHHAGEVITALADPADKIVTPAADPDINGTKGAKLKRQAPYHDIPMTDAVRQILAAARGPVHQDDLTRQVFQIGDEHEFDRAKASLSSTLSHAAKAGRFRALGDGRFMIHNEAMHG